MTTLYAIILSLLADVDIPGAISPSLRYQLLVSFAMADRLPGFQRAQLHY